MRKHSCWFFVIFALIVTAITFIPVTSSHAAHKITIPYSYVGDGWDTVIVISNTSGTTISPIIYVDDGEDNACKSIGTLDPGQIYVSTFGDITGWVNGPAPIPGIFNVVVVTNELGETDSPFGAAVAINNSSFGGFGFQQFLSEYSGMGLYICFAILPL